jgi:hypothetical protein
MTQVIEAAPAVLKDEIDPLWDLVEVLIGDEVHTPEDHYKLFVTYVFLKNYLHAVEENYNPNKTEAELLQIVDFLSFNFEEYLQDIVHAEMPEPRESEDPSSHTVDKSGNSCYNLSMTDHDPGADQPDTGFELGPEHAPLSIGEILRRHGILGDEQDADELLVDPRTQEAVLRFATSKDPKRAIRARRADLTGEIGELRSEGKEAIQGIEPGDPDDPRWPQALRLSGLVNEAARELDSLPPDHDQPS